MDERQQQGATSANINRELVALRRIFSIGIQSTPKEVQQVPHFAMLRERNARKGFLEDAQFDKLVAGAELWFRALVECAAFIAWRHEELLSPGGAADRSGTSRDAPRTGHDQERRRQGSPHD